MLLSQTTGKTLGQTTVCRDADDVFFDTKRLRLYVSCGSGEVAVLQQDGGSLRPLPSIQTSSGTRTSLFVPELDRLFVAQRAGLLGSGAAILVNQPTP
jgi:hypothetical protein